MDMVLDKPVGRERVKRWATVGIPIALAQTMVSLVSYRISQTCPQCTGYEESTRRVG